jgi:hypothetical protein
MVRAKWLPKQYTTENCWNYERENNYPIIWEKTEGLKRECLANGKQ